MKKMLFIGLFALFSCQSEVYEEKIPQGFPKIHYPKDNEPRADRVALGKRLFFDPILSKDSTISCSSCHIPAFAYADTVALSQGVDGLEGKRNAYSLLNVAYQKALFMEGGVPSLELQALAPLGEESEQQMLISEAAKRLSANTQYQKLAKKAYGRPIDPYVITRSLAAFERTLVAGHSPYDAFLQGDTKALSSVQINGMNLFFGKANCGNCHNGFLLSNQAYENIGLYEDYTDIGRMRLTDDSLDKGKFKVPSLRNVTKTAPYMHDGSLVDLETVIDHFNRGGKLNKNKSAHIRALNLSSNEKYELLEFLKALEDTIIVGNFN